MIKRPDTLQSDGDFATVEGPLTVRAVTSLPSATHYPVGTHVRDQYGQLLQTDGVRWNLAGAAKGHVHIHSDQIASAGDLGAAIVAADSYLGSSPGTIHLPDGNWSISTSVSLSSNRELVFGVGIYTLHTTNIAFAFSTIYDGVTHPVFHSNITVRGQGWDATTIVESDSPTSSSGWAYTVFGVDGRNDSGTNTGYGRYEVRDLTIVGHSGNPVTGTNATVSFNNAQRTRFVDVRIDSTHAIGVQIGGSAEATGGQHADTVWVRWCEFIGVAQQPVAPVNASNWWVQGCKFKGGALSQSQTFLDVETNTSSDFAENFHVSNNTFDVRGMTATGDAFVGIAVLGQNPSQDLQSIGPGEIIGNTFYGHTDYTPDSSGGTGVMSQPIYLAFARDVLVSDNILRATAEILVQSCIRCVVQDNHGTDISGTPINLLDSSHCTVKGNVFRWQNFVNTAPHLLEQGTSDFNDFCDNDLGAGDGNGANYLYRSYLVTVGTHTERYDNRFGGWAGTGDEGDNLGYVEIDGLPLRFTGASPGYSPYYDSLFTRMADRRTSDNRVSMQPDAPTIASGTVGADVEVGNQWQSSRPGFITAVRFWKVSGDPLTAHTLHLWNGDTNAFPALRSVTTSSETSSGWQYVTLSPPMPVDPSRTYIVSVGVPNAHPVARCGLGPAYPIARGPLTILHSLYQTVLGGYPSINNDVAASIAVDVVWQDGEVHSHNAGETTLTTTSATDILTISNPQAGNYLVGGQYRVIGGTCDVTIVATWTDAGGTAQTATLASVLGQAAGTYVLIPVMLNVDPSASLKITATAGTASRLVVATSGVCL